MSGYAEAEVLNWPLDKFFLISDSVQRIRKQDKVSTRKLFVMDNYVSIAALLSKKVKLADYLDEIEE